MPKKPPSSSRASRAPKKGPSKASPTLQDNLPPAPAPDPRNQDLASDLDNVVPTRGYQMFPMVGLGGSAGSIPALQDFFKNVPEQTGRWYARRNGSIFYGAGSILPINDAHENPQGFVHITRDLTESRRSEEEFRAQLDELKRFNTVAVGREARMIELKQEINELCARAGEAPRYPLDFEKEEKPADPT